MTSRKVLIVGGSGFVGSFNLLHLNLNSKIIVQEL